MDALALKHRLIVGALALKHRLIGGALALKHRLIGDVLAQADWGCLSTETQADC